MANNIDALVGYRGTNTYTADCKAGNWKWSQKRTGNGCCPIIYYGDEIGMGDNIWLFDRNGVRTPMQWDASDSAGFSQSNDPYSPIIQTSPYSPEFVNVADQRADPNSLWTAIKKMIIAIKKHPVFGTGECAWLDCGSNAVVAFRRYSAEEQIMVLNNLNPKDQSVVIKLDQGKQELMDILTDQTLLLHEGQIDITMTPHQHLCLIS